MAMFLAEDTRAGAILLLLVAAVFPGVSGPHAQAILVRAEQEISRSQGGLNPGIGPSVIDGGDRFGGSIAALGDLDGEGIGDVAVGAPGDDDGSTNRGAMWILFLRADGAVRTIGHSRQKISATAGGFTGLLDTSDGFGSSVASLGDLDGDGIVDLAVGANGDDDGGSSQGAVWILFLNSNGTVKAHQKISALEGGFGGDLDPGDGFGGAVAVVGDLDGDGTPELAVGAPGDDDGGPGRGAVWILFLESDGTVTVEEKISDTSGGLGGGSGDELRDNDLFGSSIADLGDLDGNGWVDLAVGIPGRDLDLLGFEKEGDVSILYLGSGCDVIRNAYVGPQLAPGTLDPAEFPRFGSAVAAVGDVDGDGIGDLAVGARGDDHFTELGGDDRGAVWVLFLDADDAVRSAHAIGQDTGGFGVSLLSTGGFGSALAALGDHDGDGIPDLAAGAPNASSGELWSLFLEDDSTSPTLGCPPLVSVLERKDSAPGEFVSFSVGALDDIDPAPAVVSPAPPRTRRATCRCVLSRSS